MDVPLVNLGPTDSGSLQLKDSVGNTPEEPQVRLASALAELADLKARYMQLEKSADVDKKYVEQTHEAIHREHLAAERAAANREVALSELARQAESLRALSAAHKYVCDEYLAMQKKVLEQAKAYDRVQDELCAAKRTILDERARHLNELERATRDSDILTAKLHAAKRDLGGVRAQITCAFCDGEGFATHTYPCMHVTCLDCSQAWNKAQESNYKDAVARTGNEHLDPKPWYKCLICRKRTGVLREAIAVPALMALAEHASSCYLFASQCHLRSLHATVSPVSSPKSLCPFGIQPW
ncbi:hypothetical protein K466DRAFT_570904 [Polyporus arcularius HHB13444]|uniref:RING-type domain-containing protein n=1 Tax=Polyporus arcularius HHB13444 TaxID=1314778 RepID=A0A5C3NM93_9APHY|nr:hypothetical protein K466DRAFT_570904 [Polyporus arcularius HHB13444]